MVSAALEKRSGIVTGTLLNPFIVLDGTFGPGTGRPTLDTLYKDWPHRPGNTATVAFHPRHWFDKRITKRWLIWLRDQYPAHTRIGLIWDCCPSHENASEVAEFLSANASWVVSVLIPAGMTSLLQVCDIAVNADLKRAIRKWYVGWRRQEISRLVEEGAGLQDTKCIKLPRDTFIKAVEQTFREFNAKQPENPTLVHAFTKLGQNWFNPDDTDIEFGKHINNMRDTHAHGDGNSTEVLSKALHDSQVATRISDEHDVCFSVDSLLN